MNPYIQSKEVKRQQLSEDWGKKKGSKGMQAGTARFGVRHGLSAKVAFGQGPVGSERGFLQKDFASRVVRSSKGWNKFEAPISFLGLLEQHTTTQGA